ncbi:SpoIIE family protein phosphatase [Saccharothrix saharensis]|uniref:SpoIIE family protein phosphatase n=1 Tax=Saccharothrix saharensis TaxID=571190 RepID=UPI00367F4B18
MGDMTPAGHEIRIDHASAVHVAARTAKWLAADLGLPAALPDRAAVVASELASNLDKHAKRGTVYVHPLLQGTGVEITAVDHGPGMTDLQHCLADGNTTTGTLGVGLGAIRRMASEFVVTTAPDGTLASARIRAPDDSRGGHLDIAHLVLPVPGEERSGDVAAIAETDDGGTLLLVDGLGHGPAAADAACAAERAFHRDPTRPLPELMTALHQALRHTRGAAVAVLRLRSGTASFWGVGNITAAVLTDGHARQLPSRPGVAGLRMDPSGRHDLAVPPGSTIVLHSDGVDCRWLLDSPTRATLPPQLLAAGLIRDHRHLRDDAGVLVARTREPSP